MSAWVPQADITKTLQHRARPHAARSGDRNGSNATTFIRNPRAIRDDGADIDAAERDKPQARCL
jgi:hypothetical protein